jgi:hypothetical protein
MLFNSYAKQALNIGWALVFLGGNVHIKKGITAMAQHFQAVKGVAAAYRIYVSRTKAVPAIKINQT